MDYFVPESTVPPNKFIYVKQSTIKPPVPEARNQQILINPDFVTGMHINPRFTKKQTNQTVHVNPLMFQRIEASETNGLPTGAPNREVIVKDEQEYFAHSPKKSCNKYKLVRNVTETKTSSFSSRNKFSLDNRPITKQKYVNSFNKSKKYFSPPKTAKSKKIGYVSISGVLYKKSSNSLINTKGSTSKTNTNTRSTPLKPRLLKYTLSANGKKLTLAERTNSPQLQTKLNSSFRLSQIKNRSIQILSNKRKKSNIPCPMYRKFGKCSRKDKGCIRLHNPDQIALCTKFLQGSCFDSKCLLSHKVSAEKMATCKFFLEGMCSKDDCPYLHVKINAKADICKDFLEGFCKQGKECNKRHQFLCPDFDKSGKCAKPRCPYPHSTVVRNTLGRQSFKCKKSDKQNTKLIKTNLEIIEGEKVNNARYYDDLPLDSKLDDSSGDRMPIRPQLGVLPSFIPFQNEPNSI